MAELNFIDKIDQKDITKFLSLLRKKPKLNLGCHLDTRNDYINIDILDLPGVDVQANVERLLFIPNNSVNEIIAYDLLEHFPFDMTQEVLKEWVRILKPGGKLVVQTPDIDRLSKALINHDLPSFEVQRLLYGGQNYPSNFHKAGFTGDLLEGHILGAGCKRIIQVCRDKDSFNVTVVAIK